MVKFNVESFPKQYTVPGIFLKVFIILHFTPALFVFTIAIADHSAGSIWPLSQWKVHLAYPASLQALHSTTQKQIISFKYNITARIKIPNWQEATSIGADQSATLPSLKSLMDTRGYMLLILSVSSNGEIYWVQSIEKISTNLSPKPIGMAW